MWIAVPFALALGGRNVRNRRAGLAQAENGLNLAVTSVMNLVIILTARMRRTKTEKSRRIGIETSEVGR